MNIVSGVQVVQNIFLNTYRTQERHILEALENMHPAIASRKRLHKHNRVFVDKIPKR